LQALLDDEKDQRQREELNALYVAMTRARSRLMLSRTPARRASASATWWARMQPLATALAVPEVEESMGDRVAQLARLKLLPHVGPKPLPEGDEAKLRAAQEAAALGVELEDVDDESADLGKALHRVLEWYCGPQGQSVPMARLIDAAAQAFALDKKRNERLQRSAQAILSSRECAPFFAPDQLIWQGNEVPMTWGGKDMRLDRLVCRLDAAGVPTWWVLDYKLHPAPQNNPEYIAQLWRYREAVMALQPGEPVRCAFITGQGRLVDCTERVAGAADLFA
jgi:ATP-dependent helicase/nuclease subunit A